MAIQIDNTDTPASSQVQKTQTLAEASKEAVTSRTTESSVQGDTLQLEKEGQQGLESAVSDINDFVQNIQRSLHFSVSESSGRTIIEVYDKQTDELIRTIPSEEVQRISEAISEQSSEGLILKTNV